MASLETKPRSAFQRYQFAHLKASSFSADESLAALGYDAKNPHSLREKLGSRFAAEAASLAKIPDAQNFGESLLQFGVRLKQDGRLAAAAGVFSRIQESQEFSTALKNKAAQEGDAIAGKGSGGLRAEFLVSRLAHEATDYRTIVPMLAGSLVGQTVSTALMGRMAGATPGLITRGAAARTLASLGGLGVEIPIFVSAGRILSTGPHGSVGEDLQRAALTLGLMRVFGSAGSSVVGARTPSALRNLTPGATTFAGLSASHYLQGHLGLRPTGDGATFFTDTVATMISLGVGAHLGRGLLGPKFAAFQNELVFRSKNPAETPAQTFSLSRKFAANGPSFPAGRAALTAKDLIQAPMMMSGKNGNEGAGKGTGSEVSLNGTSPPSSGAAAPESGGKNVPLPLELVPSQEGLVPGAKPALVLVTMVPDDSGSITSYGNAPAIRRGHNGQLENYQTNPNNILVKTRYLNGHVLFDYVKPSDAVRMDENNYYPKLGTPLFNQTFKTLEEVEQSVARFAKDFEVFAMSCIMTDGANTESGKTPDEVKAVVERMMASGRHVIAGIGVRDHGTDFHGVFRSMGIPEQWIMVLEREEGDIVQGMTNFAHVTRSVGDQASFMHTSMTGFTHRPTGYGPPQQPPGTAGPVPNVSGVYPSKGVVMPATATPGATMIGQMMGVPPAGPKQATQVSRPENLAWKPDPKKPEEWSFEDGRWVFKMPAAKTETLIGRQGDTIIVDPRNPPLVSRFHAKIRKISNEEGTAYVLIAQRADVTIVREDQHIYLQGNRFDPTPGKEGESAFLEPGDKIMLGPDVSFIFRP